MRKIIVSEWISVDGHVSDKAGSLDFFARLVQSTYEEPDQVTFLRDIDTILLGRTSYELFASHWPERMGQEALTETMNKARKVVFSHTLQHAPWGNWPKAEIAAGDAITHIRQLQSIPGGAMVVWASISLAQTLMREGLVDEYQLFICPVLTGGGRKLFDVDEQLRPLVLLSATQYKSGVVCLHYLVPSP
ncbi:dihydrofolate reductase family protein [Paraflavitalea sp. CAU 1676]|uniref:dihydrofolate reductase family protein n=1 Tax=Paraflavitalea sp. CAU 1676 TaxID=3032598 RepID=UPI0023DA9271|nr:dihydrofolate reductase family protein [Paraflavitalea sp. CAU 1676]MDF2187890.1 dihydrofolate reductase family protein [Paraflavitalea sp. CAU 1676]